MRFTELHEGDEMSEQQEGYGSMTGEYVVVGRVEATMKFDKNSADKVMYIFDVEPLGVHTKARVTITECGSTGLHVRFETIARAYNHYGFVGSPEQEQHAATWTAAGRLAREFVAQYRR